MARVEQKYSTDVEYPKQAYTRAKDADADHIAREYLPKLQSYIQGKGGNAQDLFHADSWYRDALALDWDLRTQHGPEKIASYIEKSTLKNGFEKLRVTSKFEPKFVSPSSTADIEWVEFSIAFETALARGSGMVRLTPDESGTYKVYLLYTCVDELKGYEEPKGRRRPHGGRNTLKENGGANWLEQRQRDVQFKDEDPTVIIIGAGQAGLGIGARLGQLGIKCLLFDKNDRIGDNWRNRYRTLSTHDPVHTCHLPYIPFPPTWSYFTPKDKLADFFEAYASLMELNVWMQTTLDGQPTYDAQSQTWTVKLNRNDRNESRTFHPRHIVFCTGHSGEPKIPNFPGQSEFQGKVYHGTQHHDASQHGDVTGKKVIVVGTGNSGHDIAQNFYEAGAQVTMIQRTPTYIITADKGMVTLTEAMYGDDAPNVEDADLWAQSFPWPITFRMYRDASAQIQEGDKEIWDGLEKAGFALTMGIGGGGIFRNYLERGGGYYIDVGCSQIIADGHIKVKQSINGIHGFDKDALKLASGEDVPADIVVLATGYDNMRTTLRKAFGDEVADKCKDVWGIDEEGEVNTMWRNSGHPQLWFMGGNLSLCRQYSKYLAMQIKAVEEGLYKPVYNNAPVHHRSDSKLNEVVTNGDD